VGTHGLQKFPPAARSSGKIVIVRPSRLIGEDYSRREGALPATGYLPPRVRTSRRSCGGRSWWAHFEFTRINIEPIILKNKIEELRIVSAFARLTTLFGSATARLAISRFTVMDHIRVESPIPFEPSGRIAD
jgi:hypothetical protein